VKSASGRTSEQKNENNRNKRAVKGIWHYNDQRNEKQCKKKNQPEPQIAILPFYQKPEAEYNNWIEPYYTQVQSHLEVVCEEIEEYHQQ
jgi:hypothetical protein